MVHTAGAEVGDKGDPRGEMPYFVEREKKGFFFYVNALVCWFVRERERGTSASRA